MCIRDRPKVETRAVLQAFNIVILAFTAVGLVLQGRYTWQILGLIALALPLTILFAQLGLYLFKHLRDDQFRRLLIALMLIFGTILAFKELM